MNAQDLSVRDADTTDQTPAAAAGRPARFGVEDFTAVTVYLFVALCVTAYLWVDPNGRILAANRQDTLLFEWLIAHAGRAVSHGVDPLSTHLMNMPYGLNLLANTSVLALAIPFAPLTLLAGPAVSFVTLLTLVPVATATSWYLVLRRGMGFSGAAAFTAGLFGAFSPGMVSQATGHLHVAAQFLLPLIVLTVLRMRVPGRSVRTGLELAGLVVLQVFISEEMLLLTAVALAVFVLLMWFLRPEAVRPYVGGAARACAVTAGAAGALLAYPLYHQFLGAMSYQGVPAWAREYGTDLAAFASYASESLGGSPGSADHLAQGPTEENTFFGWGLLLLLAVAVVWLRRNRTVLALAATGLFVAVLSLGPTVNLHGEHTAFSGPWGLVSDLPVFDAVVPTRLGVLLTPMIALLLAISIDHLPTRSAALPAAPAPDDPAPDDPAPDGLPATAASATTPAAAMSDTASPATAVSGAGSPVTAASGGRAVARRWWLAAVAVALVPLAPTPVTTAQRPQAPEFFTSGAWREHLPAEAVVVPIAPGWDENMDVMQWQLATDLGFATSGGYFLAPDPHGQDKAAVFGPAWRPTASLLVDVAQHNAPAAVGDQQRSQAAADVRYWKATTLVMRDSAAGADAVRATVDALVGPGTHVLDVWVWDVRGLRTSTG